MQDDEETGSRAMQQLLLDHIRRDLVGQLYHIHATATS